MLGALNPYTTGLRPVPYEPWLGTIPEHWSLARMKHVLAERNERGFPGEPLLAATQTKGVVLKRDYDTRTVEATKDLHLLKLVRVGDFVISLRSFQGGIEYARNQGIISPAYTILYTRDRTTHGYLALLLKSRPFIGNLTLYVTGIRQGQNIDYVKLSRSYIPLPPPAEQAGIVRFLGAVDREVNRFIRAKHKLIKLLEEQKQSITHRAVTRGIDSNVGLTHSGFDGIGEIPTHWTIQKLKFITSHIIDCLHATPRYEVDGAYPAVRTADIEPGRLRMDHIRRVSEETYRTWTARLEPKAGDILYSREGERYGIAALVPEGMRLCISQRMMLFRVRPEHDSAFMMWQLNSPHALFQANQDTLGATAPHINISTINNYAMAVPPLQEQIAIAKTLDAAFRPIDAAIAQSRAEIRLLNEYRSRLIADVVTGKLDVREAASRLPTNGNGTELIEESEELLDEADLLEETDLDEAALEAEA